MFWAPCDSGEGAGGGGIWGHGRCPHTHADACTHTHTCTHTHLYMYRNCKWPPTWRHPCLACLTCMCMRACLYVYACVHETPPHTPTPTPTPSTHLPILQGVDPQNHLKFDNTSTYQDTSILFKDLKSVKNSPPMGGCVILWVGV